MTEPGSVFEQSERQLVRRLLAEPRRLGAIRERPKAYWLAVTAVCLGAFMGQLDASIVNLAYRPITESFHTTLPAATWVGLAYLLVLIALVTPAGRISDVVGRKLVYLWGFVVFTAGSALCVVAPDLGLLVAARVLQAVGAAMFQANSVAIIALVMPADRLGRGIGFQGAAQALGLALGPTVGGLLVAADGWHLIFLVNVPVGVVGVALASFFIPRSRHLAPARRFDTGGALLLPPAAGALLAAISLGDRLGWTSQAIVGLLATAVAATAAFLWRERRAAAPLLDLGLFRLEGFALGVSSGLLSYLVLFGTLFVVPIDLVAGEGLGAARAGIELTVLPIFLGLVAPVAGHLADRIGARPLAVAGMAATAAGLGLLALSSSSTPLRLGALAVAGIGLGLFTPPNNAAIMGVVPPKDAGVAGGVINMTRGMGTALGLAVTTLLLGAFSGSAVAGGGDLAAGVRGSLACLAGLAATAGLLTALRRRAPLSGALAAAAADAG